MAAEREREAIASFISVSCNQTTIADDPLWEDTWYLNRNQVNSQLPDMNVTGAWEQGYTGKKISVTFLDDGLERLHPDLIDNYVNGIKN